MRRIDKSPEAPESLRGVPAPDSPDDINPRVYAARDVKERLKADQMRKCAYCECRLNGDYGHTEHYRPKNGYTTSEGAPLRTPGYYWLAYDWNNLLLSCSTCNSSCKKNHFALADESARGIASRDTSRESPLLINPAEDDPARHIVFHDEIAVPRPSGGGEDPRGRYTIDTMRLNSRPDLVENRLRLLCRYRTMLQARRLAEELIRRGLEPVRGRGLLEAAEAAIREMESPSGEYSAMLRQGHPESRRKDG